MKNKLQTTKRLMGCIALLILISQGCTKDFDEVIKDNFDFTISEEHEVEGFVFESTRTLFILVPEKKVTTVNYFMTYKVTTGSGYFTNLENELVNENDTLDIGEHNFALNFKRMDQGTHNVYVHVWDSNLNQQELELTYNTEYTNFTFLLSKGVDDFVVRTKNIITVNLIRENVVEDSLEENDFEIIYQIENGTGKFYSGENEIGEGEKYVLSKGETDLHYLPETVGQHTISMTATAADGSKITRELTLNVRNKDFTLLANSMESDAYTNNPINVVLNITEKDMEGDSYSMSYTSANNISVLEYDGKTYSPGEVFEVPVGSFNVTYTGISDGSHNVVFSVRSSSEEVRTATLNFEYEKYEEFFDLSVSQSTVDKYEGVPFQLTSVTNASDGHDVSVIYEMTYSFTGTTAGYVIYKGIVYREGEIIPLDYGSTPLLFNPETEDNFNINFRVENSTGIYETISEPITMLKRPSAKVKGEKHNVSCGGWNGCSYETRIYTCWDTSCSEAFNGASLKNVEIRIWNRATSRYDVFLKSYNDAIGTGVERMFILEHFEKESSLNYLDQRYEVRVQDSNGEWSDTVQGTIIRV